MSKKTRILEVLNKRRVEIQNNIEKIEKEVVKYQFRINSLRDNHDQYLMELTAIDIPLSDLAKKENLEVKLHFVHGVHETN